jgi:hypothetical protein
MDSVKATISSEYLSDVLQSMRKRPIETAGCLPV